MQIEWNKPSEELPKSYKRTLFAVKHDNAIRIESGFYSQSANYNAGRFFANHDDSLGYDPDKVLTWCYAPCLPAWCEEE